MSFIKEFKEFATRGNVVDLAVGIIIGGAFGKIVTSVVSDVLMPIINPLVKLFQPNDDWKTIQIGPGIKLGSFIGTVVDFIIVAFAIFLLIKAINRFQKKKETVPAAPPAPSKEEVLLTEIRDILKNK
jgi:large conductance mechanosensitive channel